MKLRTLTLALVAVAAASSLAQTVDPSLFKQLTWRNIGPFRGGRSLAGAGSAARPKEYYFGATGGGVWKTTDGGNTWACVSDGYIGSSSVGAIAISASNPDLVYAGTGERDIRGDISHGDGMYKTEDGGKTWAHIGLEDTQNVSKIQVDPKNPDVVYVAALGHVYGSNDERGVFKSTDGGKDWRKVLFESNKAGAVDLCMDPGDSSTLYASTWEAGRTAYGLNSGGDGSKLYKSADGGEHWTDLSRKPGMPKGVLGKIGITVSPVNSKRLWASVEAKDGGIFMSDDAGATWKLVNEDREWRQRAWYYSHVIADTKNADSVYDLNVSMGKSTDGGKTFGFKRPPHGDNHDLWIAPDDPNRMIETNDGGAAVTTDGGNTWTAEAYATAEIYHVTADNAFPYHLLGAQQDSSTVRILSRTERGSITRNDWTNTAGGESGYVTAKPNDPNIVYGGNYGGNVEMTNHLTNQNRAVDPWPDNPMGHGAIDLKERFQWTFPIVFSPNNPEELYTASQHLFRTTNGGNTWKQISPDLTRNDPKTLQSSGGPITKDNTSVEYYGTIFTVAESPVHPGTIWTGSDDGLVHVTRDGGGHWDDVTPKDMPHWGKVSMVEASPHKEGTAFIAVDNHCNDDFAPYAYRTDDFGKTWTPIINGIPKNTFFRVVREDPKKAGLLFAGTEIGAYVSFDDGANWQPLQLNLPLCPVHDLIIKEDDLCAATHGRSFWILDDITPLRQLAGANASASTLFPPKDPYRTTFGGFGFGGFGGNQGPSGKNPLNGLVVDYYLSGQPKSVKFSILDSKGAILLSKDGTAEPGAHRTPIGLSVSSYRTFPGMITWSGFPSPIPLPPGNYKVRMDVDGASQEQAFHLVNDPRSAASEKDLQEQYALTIKIRDRLSEANDAIVQIRDLKKKITQAQKDCGSKADVGADATALAAKLTEVEEEIYQVQNRTGEDPLNFPIKLNDRLAGVYSNVQSGPYRPTDQSYQVFDMLSGQLQAQLDKLHAIYKDDLASFNKKVATAGVKELEVIDPSKIAQPEQRRRRGGEEEDGD